MHSYIWSIVYCVSPGQATSCNGVEVKLAGRQAGRQADTAKARTHHTMFHADHCTNRHHLQHRCTLKKFAEEEAHEHHAATRCLPEGDAMDDALSVQV